MNRRQIGRLAVLSVLAWLATAAWVPSASARTDYFNNNCSGCHGSTSDVAPYPDNTCAGCHAHGIHSGSSKSDINVTATPNSTSYNPGDPMTVSVTGGYRDGWVRVQMWDLDCSAATCNQGNALVSESRYTSGNTVTFPGPVVLNATAPNTPGSYTWSAGWYGNEFDETGASFAGIWIPDVSNGGHGNQLVTFTFTVNPVTPPETICDDGVDNNSNGLTDCEDPDCDGFVGDATTCGVGACASSGNLVCQTPDQVDTCTPGTPGAEGPFNDASCNDGIDNDCDDLTDAADPDCAAPPEICDNGIDDNLNGLTDCADPQCDNFVYGATSCGVGACEATGQEVCQTPDIVDTCTPGAPGAEGPFGDASCTDGIDNDCDGLTDVDDPDCEAPPEICDNGIDDNLNGLTDCEDPQCDGATFGACDTGNPGVCAAGTLTCDGSAVGPVCEQDQTAGTEGPFTDPTCFDGLDNDCNGLTDEFDPNCQPVPEICNNNVDDNDNGLVDCADPDCEGYIGQPGDCSTGLPGICSAGTTTCTGGQKFCEQDTQAGPEGPFDSPTCSDGLDNDCDNLTDANDPDCTVPPEVCDNDQDDNGNGLVDCEDPQCADATFGACDTGNPGICSAGTLTCDGSQPGAVCTQDQTAQPEGPFGSPTCTDGLDNDCDGLTDAADPDCAEPVVEICDNNVDDNGNGLTDCQDPECDQVSFGACDTGEPGICAAGTLICDGTAIGPVCEQNQQPGVEGPYTSATCSDGLDNDCDGLIDEDDPDCDAPVADVYLSRMQAPKKLNVRAGTVTNRKATVRGDGTLLTQDATVTLTGTGSPNVGVVVEPASATEQVVPGKPETRFGFTVSVSCNASGAGTVEWTATIDAPGNDDPSNDVLTGTTSVTCR
jgi:hypothetical protein